MNKLKRLLLVSPFLLSSLQATTLQEVVESSMKLQQIIPTGVIDTSCVQCSEYADVEPVSELKEDNFCSNIYANSCLNSDGTASTENSFESEKNELKDKYKEARDLGAQSIGFKDYEDALVENIRKLGFEMPKEITKENLRFLTSDYNDGATSELNFPAKEKCAAADNFKKVEHLENAKIRYSSLDIPNFLENEFERCTTLKKESKKYPLAFNMDLTDRCSRFPSVRQMAIDLYRSEDAPGYEERAQKFIKDNILPRAVDKISDDESYLDAIKRTDEKAASEACEQLNGLYNRQATIAVENFSRALNKSKPVVEKLISTYYDEKSRQEIIALLNTTKKNIKELLPKITKNEAKLKNISSGYDNMELAWLEKPSENRYKKDKHGLMVLETRDEDNRDESDRAFGNSKLTYFTEINAFYTALEIEDQTVTKPDTVHMMPYFLKTLQSNKYNFLAVLAHEAGHKIGPDISKYNGHDLRPEWKNLIDCYKQNDSIKMIDSQKDETIADYVSSEVLANVIGELPAHERKDVFKKAMRDFCLFDDCNNIEHSVQLKETHPDNILRINGILGSNPKLREVLGCSSKNENYRSCSL